MRPARSLLLAALLGGCTEVPAEPSACLFDPPAEGSVHAGEVVCANPLPEGRGDVRANDLLLANSRMSVVLRHPVNAASMPGIGGLTITDAAPWGLPDPLYEVIPLIDGGWMTIDALEQLEGGFRVQGEGAPLPDQAERYRRGPVEAGIFIEPDSPWLRLEGIDGLWIHATGPAELAGGWVYSQRTVIGHDGSVEQDLGGAIRVLDASRLLITDHATALSLQGDTSRQVALHIPRSHGVLRWWAGDELVAVTPVQALHEGPVSDTPVTLELQVGERLDAVQWTARDGTPAAITPLTTQTTMQPLPTRTLEVQLVDGSQVPLDVSAILRWHAPWGTASTRITAGTATVQIPEGEWPVSIEPELSWQPTTSTWTVDASSGTLRFELQPALDATDLAPADLFLPSYRDWTRRVGPDVIEDLAATSGLVSTRLYATHDAGEVSSEFPGIRPEPAWHLPHPSGWALWAWPVSADAQLGGHGAPDIAQLSPQLAFERADGGAGSARTVVANLRWFELVRPDPSWRTPLPSMIRLGPPGDAPFSSWEPWFRILDGFRPLYPAGDLLWLQVRGGHDTDGTAIRTALDRGTFTAGTGAALTWTVDGQPPGGVLTTTEGPHIASIRIQPGRATLDQAAIVTSDREVIVHWSGDALPASPETLLLDGPLGDWLVLVAWSTTTDDWATTPAIWTRPPYTPEKEDTGVDSGAPEESGAPP